MKIKKNWHNLLFLIIIMIFLPWHPAAAYVDPGTGSYVVQVIIGIFFGAIYATKGWWKSLIFKIKNKNNKKNNTDK